MIQSPERLALCLSGGGFRAALFHLGVLRRLSELGILARIDTISAVSGGAIVAAFLADRLQAAGATSLAEIEPFHTRVAEPFHRFANRDLRSGPVFRHILWNWAVPGPLARSMVSQYRRHLTSLKISQLPKTPRFVFCATDVAFGVNFTIERERIGDYQLGYSSPGDLDLAWAVAASACFPPLFGPLTLPLPASHFKGGAYRGPDREQIVRRLSLTDGGVYDNLGLEPALRNHTTVIVSDAGGPFPFVASRAPFLRFMRYPGLVMKQVSSLRRRQLMSLIDDQRFRCQHDGPHCRVRIDDDGCPHSDEPGCRDHRRGPRLQRGAYLGIHSNVDSYHDEDPGSARHGYPASLVGERITRVRTDLDRFTESEQFVLENHGYCLADAAIQQHLGELVAADSPPAQPPHPDLMDPARASTALATSHRRFSFTRTIRRS